MDIDEQEVPYTLIKEFGKKDTKIEEILPVAKNLELPDGLTRFYEKEKIGLMGNRAITYFKSRKIEPRMDFGYIFKPDSEYNNRVFIPFYENGEIVYFLTRTFIDDPLRFKNPPGFDSKNYVFNIDQMNGDVVLLCEGVFDALSVKEPVASCILSADLGRQQAIKIFNKSPKAIIMVPDNDETGSRTLKRNIELLRLYKPQSLSTKFYVYTLPEGIKDLNELLVKTGKDKITLAECKEIQKEEISLKQSKRVTVGI
jgi:DNA primase